MQHHSTVVRSVGVDTLTCSVDWGGGIHSFIDLAQYLQREEAAGGSRVMPFVRRAYRGVQTKHVGLAFAPGRVLAELRGNAAHEWWPHFLDRAERVSRLDLEVSVRQEPYDHELALDIWREARKQATIVGRPSKYRLQSESDGGTTLYIGKGASRYQARLYERFYKTKQEDDKDTWRYEVQCRRERAGQVADLLRGAGDPQLLAASFVHQHFRQRGVAPIFTSESDLDVAPLSEDETDKDRNLRWLSSSVQPALGRHRSWGSYVEALRALGIDQEAADL